MSVSEGTQTFQPLDHSTVGLQFTISYILINMEMTLLINPLPIIVRTLRKKKRKKEKKKSHKYNDIFFHLK